MLDRGRVLDFESSQTLPVLTDDFECFSGVNLPQNVDYYSNTQARRLPESVTALIYKRFDRVRGCGKTWVKQTVLKSDDVSYSVGDLVLKRVSCKTVFCPNCGRKGGVKHLERKLRVFEHLKRVGDLENLTLGQFIFTLPESQRQFFMSRDRLLSFRRLCVDAIRKYCPGRLPIVYVHLFGDRDLEYKPHVNIHTVHKRGEWISVSAESLSNIKNFVRVGLEKIGCDLFSTDIVNMQYSMKLTKPKVCHAIKYMTRPVPSYDIVMNLLGSSDDVSLRLLEFIAVELDGFAYLNYPRLEWDVIRGSGSLRGLIPGVVLSRGVREKMTWLSFVDQYRTYERREIYPGVYHIHGGRLSKGGASCLPR